VWSFDGSRWVEEKELLAGLSDGGRPLFTIRAGKDRGVRWRALGNSAPGAVIVGNERTRAVFLWSDG
jgi:hypothetical protein